jgi:hypothetical protein
MSLTMIIQITIGTAKNLSLKVRNVMKKVHTSVLDRNSRKIKKRSYGMIDPSGVESATFARRIGRITLFFTF